MACWPVRPTQVFWLTCLVAMAAMAAACLAAMATESRATDRTGQGVATNRGPPAANQHRPPTGTQHRHRRRLKKPPRLRLKKPPRPKRRKHRRLPSPRQQTPNRKRKRRPLPAIRRIFSSNHALRCHSTRNRVIPLVEWPFFRSALVRESPVFSRTACGVCFQHSV